MWWFHGLLHRDKGLPAVEIATGKKEWWVNGIEITPFKLKYQDIHKIRAQKKIYFWIIPRLYRFGGEPARRLAEKSWQKLFFKNLKLS